MVGPAASERGRSCSPQSPFIRCVLTIATLQLDGAKEFTGLWYAWMQCPWYYDLKNPSLPQVLFGGHDAGRIHVHESRCTERATVHEAIAAGGRAAGTRHGMPAAGACCQRRGAAGQGARVRAAERQVGRLSLIHI